MKIQRRNFIMNKADLVAAMAEKAGVSKKDAEASLKAFTDVVAEELKKGEKIQGPHTCLLFLDNLFFQPRILRRI